MGIKPSEFWFLTWGEIDVICRGYEMRLARSRELPRYIATILINANRGKNTQPISPEDVLPLITDKRKSPVKLMTKEEFEEIKRDVEVRYGREETNG
mgnify:CR=1 FL=1